MRAGEKGRSGEELALLYLQSKGYALLEQNFRFQRCEIDLILRDGETLVFVEVKQRSREVPRLAVDRAKQQRLCRAALGYAAQTGCLDRPLRFDVVEVLRQGGELRLRHLPGAFEFIKGRYFA